MRLYGIILVVTLIFGSCVFWAAGRPHAPARSADDCARQAAVIGRQLAALEPQIRQKQKSLAALHQRLLQTNGRLVCRTILADNSSRLALADAVLRGGERAREAESVVSRTYARSDGDFDITMPSAVTAYEFELVFEGTPLRGLGKAFVQAELETGLNAMFLAAVAVIESDWGNSLLAAEKNNLFGFGAYDSDVNSARSFADKRECILYVAGFLREHYIDGSYYRGHSIRAVNELYASDGAWADKVYGAMRRMDRMIQEKFE